MPGVLLWHTGVPDLICLADEILLFKIKRIKTGRECGSRKGFTSRSHNMEGG